MTPIRTTSFARRLSHPPQGVCGDSWQDPQDLRGTTVGGSPSRGNLLRSLFLAATLGPALGAGAAFAQEETPAAEDEAGDLKPTNHNGAFVRLELNRHVTLVKPFAKEKYTLGGGAQASWQIGGVNLATKNWVDLSKGGLDAHDVWQGSTFTPQIISNTNLRFRLFEADIHQDFHPWAGSTWTLGGDVQANLREQVKIDPLYEIEQPAPAKPSKTKVHSAKPASPVPELMTHEESVEGVAGLYLKGRQETSIGTFRFEGKAELKTWAWTHGTMTPAPQVSPEFSARESFTPQGTEFTIGLQQDWWPAEQFTRYAVQVTHPLPTGAIKSEIGVYAGHQVSKGKVSDFVGTGITVHF